eukprot:gnl/MRDRNA2_/MRDRNA2_63857_c0_seq1.p1 gnl/MRDRNA2_/MRDRNA2_63857_c0~~gnl/MRDRNA2_/MRDRNA2_63857_c0_seq1.p1  ORF type:complete len:160 (-),score=15.67 gnl/MRDRNA2_/MRDRNA2_63857_c0_seq1:201-680(-)
MVSPVEPKFDELPQSEDTQFGEVPQNEHIMEFGKAKHPDDIPHHPNTGRYPFSPPGDWYDIVCRFDLFGSDPNGCVAEYTKRKQFSPSLKGILYMHFDVVLNPISLEKNSTLHTVVFSVRASTMRRPQKERMPANRIVGVIGLGKDIMRTKNFVQQPTR